MQEEVYMASNSADKLFTLDPVQTQLSESVNQVVAQKSINTATRDAQVVGAIGKFSAALGSLAEIKKQQRIREDTRTAENAAVRNEVMPGGLLPVAQQAYRDVVDINTSNNVNNEIKTWLAGDEIKAIINDPDTSSEIKNNSINAHLDGLYVSASESIQNPNVLLGLKTKIDVHKVDTMKDVYEVEKNLSYGVALQSVSGQVSSIFNQNEIDPTDIIDKDGKWFKAVTSKLRTSLPWVSDDDAKLAVFNTILNNEEALNHEDLIFQMMQMPFSKGVTFGALADSRTTEAGKEIFKIHEQYQNNVATNYRTMEQAEKDAQSYLNDEGIAQGMTYLQDNAKNPERFIGVTNLLVQQIGSDYQTAQQLVKLYQGMENTAKLGVDSVEFSDAKDAIVENIEIENEEDLLNWVIANNLNSDAYSKLSTFLRSENKQYGEAKTVLKESINTVNNSIVGSLKSALSSEPVINRLMGLKDTKDITPAEMLALVTGKSTVDPIKFVQVMQELQIHRDAANKAIEIEARIAAQENREPDTSSIQSSFNTAVLNFTAKVKELKGPVGGEIAKPTEADVKKVDVTVEPLPTPPRSDDTNTPETKRETLDTLIGAEKDVFNFAKKTWDMLTSPRKQLFEESSKQVLEFYNKQQTPVMKFPIDPSTIRPTQIIKEEIKETGEIPKREVVEPAAQVKMAPTRSKAEQSQWNNFWEIFSDQATNQNLPTTDIKLPSAAPEFLEDATKVTEGLTENLKTNIEQTEKNRLRAEDITRRRAITASFGADNIETLYRKDAETGEIVDKGVESTKDLDPKLAPTIKGFFDDPELSTLWGPTKDIVSLFRTSTNPDYNPESGHSDGTAADLRTKGKMWKQGIIKISKNLEKSATKQGWEITLTETGKKTIRKGNQLWSKFSNKDGDIMLIELVEGSRPHVHIHLGENKLEPKGWK